MFGGAGKKPKKDESLSSVMSPENAPTRSGGSSVTGFDPEGLERAAKAARELDASRNASSAIELVKTQEATKQHEAAAKRAEMDAYSQQLRQQNIQAEAEEARKTLEAQTQHDKHRSEYKDELERKRQVDMLNAQKYMQDEQLKKQEEMVERQESMRRKTAEIEADLRTKTELAKTQAEAEGRIRQERENHDLILDKVRLEAAENRNTVLKAVSDGGKMLGEGLSSYLTDGEKLRNTAFMVSLAAVGIYSAKTAAGIGGRFIEARLGKPSLVRETSRVTVSQMLKHPISSAQRLTGLGVSSQDALKGIVLEDTLDSQLRKIAVSTAHTKKNKAPFRHLLLHGPPGTGKTMFAKGLAHHSGLEFAILTGGDIAPLGRDAVTEIHKLFEWAKTSRKGLLLFVDEADAFLQSRETNKISEDQRNALNAFLYRTGTESDQFMMVYASNQPSQFDEAVLDRIDEMVEFDLPGEHERRKMVALYIEKYLLNPPARWAKKVTTVDIGDEEIERVVKETEGFSGRAISKLAIAWQAAAYGTDGAILDKETFFSTVQNHKKSMSQKDGWMQHAIERADMLTTDR
ncbi:AAA ATPase [Skeletonema marinoi]|uniref:AAA ATPase n=2 Tax=Skeletonema marinoi TaxID=267567 RepID=A0AAD8YFS0_9STRA|nr:AAA ATPase [Skeletonema marinoi]|mmetsp:Transcript_13568/g.27551  ORF Transcript_13568/g.27551 Transcript_13568/m.27551 type:complete len:575 (+) Transcript_13568:171-1895(+)|eukprot:CAMPEP_0113374656 /NCGR_PEP_ID=MMETSP0013_2-20120614/1697_1 /TAXON_ID=2843 ORGANISM="Skeletonema costatum, Strain 1716" /NCGR_SAMPLE_ID=MMETSP0013_2 /ASSEMBLY_ACC=CAM_ASM_000158 /LENGTH=574 /DNA_ID=CAMNT_0000256655 /DNA_START=101 /DNA_END=1825 /DNA_ORIENTATION=+ /assembly_acc=CAM_ASM_000158